MTWTENIQKHILNIEHRHVLFTIPEECRKFFFYDRSLLSKLSADVNQVFKFIFHNISRKRKRKNKISEHSKYYFTDSDIVHYGLISVIHTFGRDLKWNPHIHAIVSLGGFNKNLKFKKMRYFNVDTIAGQWKYHSFMDFIQGIFLTGLKRQLMLSGKTLPCQDIHFIKGRCTRLSG